MFRVACLPISNANNINNNRGSSWGCSSTKCLVWRNRLATCVICTRHEEYTQIRKMCVAFEGAKFVLIVVRTLFDGARWPGVPIPMCVCVCGGVWWQSVCCLLQSIFPSVQLHLVVSLSISFWATILHLECLELLRAACWFLFNN